MPVVLSPDVWSEWLGEEQADPSRLQVLLAPYPADEMACWPVSTRSWQRQEQRPELD
jgi:putative SOS response-associated peptidase YedK